MTSPKSTRPKGQSRPSDSSAGSPPVSDSGSVSQSERAGHILADLIGRLEKLTGPDPHVDYAIGQYLWNRGREPAQCFSYGTDNPTKLFTYSIDVALLLLPPKAWEPHTLAFPHGVGRTFGFEIYPPRDHPRWSEGSVIGRGSTAAIAICVAGLMCEAAIAKAEGRS